MRKAFPKAKHVPYVPTPRALVAPKPARPHADEEVALTCYIRRSDLPALRSAIDEIRTAVGGRLEGSARFAREHALTRAVIALGALGAAVNAKTPKGDPDYAR